MNSCTRINHFKLCHLWAEIEDKEHKVCKTSGDETEKSVTEAADKLRISCKQNHRNMMVLPFGFIMAI